MRESARKRRLDTYGITAQDYNNLILIQNNKCAICGSNFDLDDLHKTCHIDHDHKTGVVRGLGKFQDSEELLKKAGDYLAGKRALITGIGGQDGQYLSHFLRRKGYEVHGLIRRTSQPNPLLAMLPETVILHEGDVTDFSSILRLLIEIRPHEVYNLAAQSHVGTSFKEPIHTTQVNFTGALNIFEACRLVNKLDPRIYQASTSEMFGGLRGEAKCNEKTPFHPRSPYGVAKVAAHNMARNYREAYQSFICAGILFNHESPHRGISFVTRKITRAAARIKLGLQDKLYLGNLDAKRDWGFAGDYVEAMWLMLQQDQPDDYVLATGEAHSVREFCQHAFEHVGLDYNDYVEVDPRFYRPAEVDVLVGNYAKIRDELGWRPTVAFKKLVEIMVDHDMTLLQ
jgi:GDPmannose 4,6-dehydratase